MKTRYPWIGGQAVSTSFPICAFYLDSMNNGQYSRSPLTQPVHDSSRRDDRPAPSQQ